MIDNVIAPARGSGETTWAQLLNTSFSAMDAHDHSIDNGDLIDSSSLNFNGDFNCGILSSWNYIALNVGNLDTILTVRTDGTDLIAVDGVGRDIYITKDGALNVATIAGGGFIGDYVSASAQATYTTSSNTYQFFNGSSQLSSLTFGTAQSSTLNFPEIFNCVLFSVSVAATNSILFSLPTLAAGIAYVNSGVFSTTPYFTCDATNTIFSNVILSQTFGLFLTNSNIIMSAKVNNVTKYSYWFYQGKGSARSAVVDNQTKLTSPTNTSLIPFVECGFQQAAPAIQYQVGPIVTSASFRYKDPEVQYNVATSVSLPYNSSLAYQAVFFPANLAGGPQTGGLGG